MEIITHPSHPHQLTQEHTQMPYLCYGCKEVGIGSCYHCKSDRCNSYLHQECATSPFSVSHPFSKSCKFRFIRKGSKKGRICDACGKKVKGFRYECNCFFKKRNLHPQCSMYKEKYEVNGWTLNLRKKITEKCFHCEEKGNKKGWGYVSADGDCCFHVVCLWERLYDDWSKGLFTGLSFDVSEMVRLTIVKLVMKQLQLEPKKKISCRGSGISSRGSGSDISGGSGNVSSAEVVSIFSSVTSAFLNS